MNNNNQPFLAPCVTKAAQLSFLLAPLIASPSYGVGLQLMPGSPNFGSAGAGHAAIGLGAGSAWANPATMVLVEEQQVAAGLITAQTDIQFESSDGEVSGGNAGGDLLIPSFAYTHAINPNLSAGFAFVVPFGNAIDYDQDWAGKHVATSANTQTLQAMPSMAFRLNDSVSLGFGLTANETRVEQTLIMQLDPRLPAMDVALEADGLDYGWTVGGLFELNAEHRFGFVYRSSIEGDLEGEGRLGDTTYDTQLNWENPASFVISGVHLISERTTVLWDLGRTFYSEFETTNVDVDGLMALSLHRNWQDANRYAIGTHYQLSDDVILQAGYSLDESPVKTADRNVDMPLDDIQRFTLGSLYQLNDSTSLAVGLEYADLGSPKTQADPNDGLFAAPNGQYDNHAIATSFSVNYQF